MSRGRESENVGIGRGCGPWQGMWVLGKHVSIVGGVVSVRVRRYWVSM